MAPEAKLKEVPACSHEGQTGKYCANCGADLQSTEIPTSGGRGKIKIEWVPPVLVAISIIIFLYVINWFASDTNKNDEVNTNPNLTNQTSAESTIDEIVYSNELVEGLNGVYLSESEFQADLDLTNDPHRLLTINGHDYIESFEDPSGKFHSGVLRNCSIYIKESVGSPKLKDSDTSCVVTLSCPSSDGYGRRVESYGWLFWTREKDGGWITSISLGSETWIKLPTHAGSF